jgi:hypothetical protein
LKELLQLDGEGEGNCGRTGKRWKKYCEILDIGNEEQIGYPASKLTDIVRDYVEQQKDILKTFQCRIFSAGTLCIYIYIYIYIYIRNQ